MKTPQQIKNEVETTPSKKKEFRNYIALFLFVIGALILNYWTNNMLLEQSELVRIVGQIGINIPLLFIFISNKFYKLREVTPNDK